jgi:hypothetical protein
MMRGVDLPEITVRDWRRKPPLRLYAPRRLGICWLVNCNNAACAHAAVVAIVPCSLRL